MDIESFRKAGYQAIDQICDYYASIERRPVMAQVEPGFLRAALPDSAPEEGEEWSRIASDYQTKVLPGITHWQHPMFYAYYPANATFEGMLADLHAASISNPGFNWSVSPSVTELELITLDWIAKMFGMSNDFLTTSPLGGGIILNSASEVAITVAVAARERMLALMESKESNANRDAESLAEWRGHATSKLIMYGTSQTHSIGVKAAMVLGLAFRAIDVRAEDDYSLRGAQLLEAIEEDRRKGLTPFMLIATVGSTSSGAVDNLAEIEDVCKEHCANLWIHVDAAYAGVCLALDEAREACYLEVINRRVDSFSTNLHKWGLVNFDCSPLHVRRRADLSNALTVTPEFLRTKHGDAGSVLDLRNMQLSLGRRFRSLKVWFVLRSFGLQGFRAHLRKHIELSSYFNDLIASQRAPLRIVAKPRWSLTVFKLVPSNLATEGEEAVAADADADADTDADAASAADRLNRRFWDALQTRNDALLLTQTVLPQVGFCIRFVIGSPATEREHVRQAYEILCQEAERVLSHAA